MYKINNNNDARSYRLRNTSEISINRKGATGKLPLEKLVSDKTVDVNKPAEYKRTTMDVISNKAISRESIIF